MQKNNILGEKKTKKHKKTVFFFKKKTVQGVRVSPGSVTPVYLSLGPGPVLRGTLARRARAGHLFGPVPLRWPFRGCTKGAHLAQCSYFGRVVVLETHTLRY